MKKLILSAIVTAFMSITVQAHDSLVPAWACQLNFKGHARGIQVIVGRFDVKARGTLRCISPFSEMRTIPVSIDISTKYLAPRVAFGSFDVYGETAQIGLFTFEPEHLLGRYLVAQGQGALIAGAGVMTAVHATIPDISMQVSVQFVRGFGLNLGLTTMTIRAID